MPRETAEFDVQDFENPEMEKGVYARFYTVPKPDEVKSAEEGRPVFKDVVYIEIIAAGNANNIIRKPAREMDFRRFHKQHQLFLRGDNEQIVGTPLTEVPWVTRSQVEEMAYRKIRTLEDLAEMSDAACSMPGMYELKRKAIAWLEKSKEAAPFTKMQAEMDAMRAELAALKAEKEAAPAKKAAG